METEDPPSYSDSEKEDNEYDPATAGNGYPSAAPSSTSSGSSPSSGSSREDEEDPLGKFSKSFQISTKEGEKTALSRPPDVIARPPRDPAEFVKWFRLIQGNEGEGVNTSLRPPDVKFGQLPLAKLLDSELGKIEPNVKKSSEPIRLPRVIDIEKKTSLFSPKGIGLGPVSIHWRIA